MFAYIIHGSITWYEYYDLITKLITGIAPFIAAFGAYYMWSKNREKEIKNLEYKNDYYKKIIDKRMEAYEQLEKFIASLKVTTPGKENKMYHVYFSTEVFFNGQTEETLKIVSKSIWLSEDINDLMLQFNQILYLFPNNNDDTIMEYAKKEYHKIACIREGLEKHLASDLLKLYDVKKFLAEKANLNGGLIPFRTK